MAHPTQLGKYSIEGVIGSGAMGMVYKGIDPVIQRPVALKTIHRSLVGDDDAVSGMAARFRNEAKASGRMLHPGIVAIYEYGEDGDTAFIAMEFVEGQDLSKVLQNTPVLPEPMVLQIMDHLLSALDYAHQQGVWHRDIKPANLILTRTGQLKIADFGIARIRDAGLTQVTSTIGTHGFMAPEQYKGDDIDHRVDIFAAGVLLYRLLTGEMPFAGSQEQIMYKVLHEASPTPSTHSQKRGLQLDSVVAKAMEKDVRQRYATAAAFREALLLHAGKVAPKAASGALDDDATIVIGTTATIPPAVFDAAVLSHVEKSLASFVGPLAKILVKQALATSRDFNTLIEAVAKHVTPDEERAKFVAKVHGAGSTASPHTHTTSSTTEALSEGLVAHATRVLTHHMGPIAKVIVKKAMNQSRGVDAFFEALLSLSGDGIDREALLKELRQGVKPQA